MPRPNKELPTTVYRKPTHNEGYSTNHPTTQLHTKPRLKRHSATRPQLQVVCDTGQRLRDENRYLERAFRKKNYNADFIRRNITDPTALQHLCSPQTYNYVTTLADQRQGAVCKMQCSPTLVRLAEALINTKLTEQKRATRSDANNHIAVHYQLTNRTTLTGSVLKTNYFQHSLTRESCYINLERSKPTNDC